MIPMLLQRVITMSKKTVSLFLVFLLILSLCVPALADNSASGAETSELIERLVLVPEFKFRYDEQRLFERSFSLQITVVQGSTRRSVSLQVLEAKQLRVMFVTSLGSLPSNHEDSERAGNQRPDHPSPL